MSRSTRGCSFADISIIIPSLFNVGWLFVSTSLAYDVFGSPIQTSILHKVNGFCISKLCI
jgi:cytochrome b559 alpha subunit